MPAHSAHQLAAVLSSSLSRGRASWRRWKTARTLGFLGREKGWPHSSHFGETAGSGPCCAMIGQNVQSLGGAGQGSVCGTAGQFPWRGGMPPRNLPEPCCRRCCCGRLVPMPPLPTRGPFASPMPVVELQRGVSSALCFLILREKKKDAITRQVPFVSAGLLGRYLHALPKPARVLELHLGAISTIPQSMLLHRRRDGSRRYTIFS